MPDVPTKHCPFCAEEIRGEAVKCRYCGSFVTGNPLSRTWYRSRTNRRIAGVCGGLAEEFGISVTVLRLAFVLATLMSVGLGLVLYLTLWVVMPYRPAERFRLPDDASAYSPGCGRLVGTSAPSSPPPGLHPPLSERERD